jgi:hypothetical protein
MTVTLFRGTRRLADAYSDGFTLAVHRCGSCGIVFAFEEEFDTTRRRDHASWYCPNGHSFSYTGPSDVEKLRSELEEERQRRKAARDLLDHEQRSHAATRGHLTRTKKRIWCLPVLQPQLRAALAAHRHAAPGLPPSLTY